MEPVQNARKVWAKPVVQMLDINNDTYTNPGRTNAPENGGVGNNNDKKSIS